MKLFSTSSVRVAASRLSLIAIVIAATGSLTAGEDEKSGSSDSSRSRASNSAKSTASQRVSGEQNSSNLTPTTTALSTDTPVELDEAEILFKQLGELEASSTGNAPLVIPKFIDRPDEIDDQNVGPIPTQPTDIVEGSASEATTTTIPVVPDSTIGSKIDKSESGQALPSSEQPATPESNVYEVTPRLLTQSDRESVPTIEVPDQPASAWQLAAAQLVATFLGVLLAISLFLVIRVAAMKLFDRSLGITFHISSATNPPSRSINDELDANVVPFGAQLSTETESTSQAEEDKQNEEQPASVPLRRVA